MLLSRPRLAWGSAVLATVVLLVGSAGNDTLLGDAGDDALLGGPGQDVLDGGVGDNVLIQD
jgi:Ca2+-binding RTX toxin-like protein